MPLRRRKMAVTKIWDIRGRIDKLINYVVNPEKTVDLEYSAAYHSIENVIEYDADSMKTEEHLYVTGINCDENNAVQEFMNVKRKWQRLGGIVAYHGYQSFAGNEVDAQTAHDIGVELATRLWGERFQVVVTTHCNTGHYHNHFALNSISYIDGKRYYDNKETYRLMREESDRLCKEYGLSVIDHPKDKGMNYSEWRAEQEGVPTLRSSIRSAIDLAIKGSTNKAQFLSAMDEMGFIIDKSGKHAKIKHVGTERFVRFKSLGEGYSVEEIIKRIYASKERAHIDLPPQDDPQNVFEGEEEPVKIMSYIPLYRSYNRALKIAKERPHYNFHIYYLVRQDISAKRLYEDSLDLLLDHDLKTGQDVIDYKAEAMRQIDENIRLRNEARNHLKRAERARDLVEADKARFNINIYSMTLSKLRREVTTCDEVLERSRHVRDNLTVIEQEKFKGKAGVVNEHISGRGGSSRSNEPKRS